MSAAPVAAVQLAPAERADVEREILLEEEAERIEARTSLEVFVMRYLGSEFDIEPGEAQLQAYTDLEAIVFERPIEGAQRTGMAVAWPRGHGKTTTASLGFVLWVITNWRHLPFFARQKRPPYIVLVSNTMRQARSRALDVRDHLEGNELLWRDYGPQAPSEAERKQRRPRRGLQARPKEQRRAKWTETEFTTPDGATVVAISAGSDGVRGLLRRGRRPSLIVSDDLENDKHIRSEEQRAALWNWFTKALLPTGLAGRLLSVVVGTILHADSLLAKLLGKEHFPDWLKRRHAALRTEEGIPSASGTVALWPGLWPVHLLLQRLREIGSVAFAQEYLNIPLDDLSALFRRAWLDAALQRGRGRGFLYAQPPRLGFDRVIQTWDQGALVAEAPANAYQVLVTAWDLALVEDEKDAIRKNTDYTVGISVGLLPDDRFEVARLFRKRGMTPAQMRERVVAEQCVVGADYIIVENNAAQRIHEIELRGIADLPIRGHTTDRRKHDVFEGVPGLAYLLELDRIDFCWSTPQEKDRMDVLVSELHGLGAEAHDDTVMALWMAVVALRKWVRVRDAQRRKLLGAPPAGYVAPIVWREATT